MAEIAMDALDKAILTALLADGRQSQVGLGAARAPVADGDRPPHPRARAIGRDRGL